ncbi:hypothetical protein CGLO_13027 [Colletotrichum gloeosporioides Cg-14]|uniref:Uncharacterized protein n=1 Tax=Colletotrichum gloeosporioides (strain Cg-14) TaxID=1237896 RepID=T0L839_COLGC|nr:hypothetical protein CGLO_13027 [Colletotrichum gloeosporioides Cg-14]
MADKFTSINNPVFTRTPLSKIVGITFNERLFKNSRYTYQNAATEVKGSRTIY